MRILILIAFRNLVQARRRTALLSVALALVTMFFVLLLSLSAGITDTMIRSATTLHTGHVNISGFYKTARNDSVPLITDVERLREIVREEVPELDYMVARHRGWTKVISPTGSLQSLVAGIDVDDEDRLFDVVEMAPESAYEENGGPEIRGDASALSEPDTIMLFAAQAETLGVDVGDMLTLRTQLRNGTSNTIDVRVVAIAEDVGLLSTFAIFVPRQVVLELYQFKPTTSGAIHLYLDDIDDAPRVMRRLRDRLEEEDYELLDYQPEKAFFQKFGQVSGEDWVGQKLDVTLWSDEVSFMMRILTAIDSISLFLIVVLLVIIAVGIMNTMWIAVRERTSEIGTVRAIGMSKASVLVLFLLEAAMLGVLASSLGGALGAALAAAIDAAELPVPNDAMATVLLSDTIHLSVDFTHVAGAVAALTLFTTLAALWPSIRAARMQPVEAISDI